MRFSLEEIETVVSSTGFQSDRIEKGFYLLALLRSFNEDPFLRKRLALKGGTALNLFIFNLPRLSVDLDFNYIGSIDKEIMLAEGPKIEEAVLAAAQREGLRLVKPVKKYHAGWRVLFRYPSALAPSGNLKVDVNFMYRIPLWPIKRMSSRKLGSYQLKKIPVVSLHELAAGKLSALFSRQASRDLFDTHYLLAQGNLDRKMMRLAFVLHGAMSPKDWLTVSSKDVGFNPKELKDSLLSLLPNRNDSSRKNLSWADKMVKDCQKALKIVLPLTKKEKEFLRLVQEHGEIHSSLLTEDARMKKVIENHPLLQWRILNVKKFKDKHAT